MLTSLNFRKLITGNKIIFNFVLFICMNFFINSSNNRQHNFKCLIVGPSDAGKTTIFCSLLDRDLPFMYIQTLGFDFGAKKYMLFSSEISVQFWDTSGDEKYHKVVTSVYRNSDIFMIIIPIDSDQPLDVLQKYLEYIKTYGSTSKCIIVLNKVDLTTKTEEEIEKLKTDCVGILKTNGLEGGVISFSAKLWGNYVDVLDNEIGKILQELIKEEEELLIKEKELQKKDDSNTGKNPYVDSIQVKKSINDVLDTTDPLKNNLNKNNLNKNNHTQKKPITNTKKSASNNNGTEDTKQTQNCISCRAR